MSHRLGFRSVLALSVTVILLLGAAPLTAQDERPLEWQPGPMTAPVGGSLAEIEVPDGFVFLDKQNTQRFMELLENPLTGSEMATVAPASDDETWFVVFEWDKIGYVDDSEKDNLDADAILESVRTGTEQANEERRRRGWTTLDIVGWHERPRYDETTNNLTWAIAASSQGHPVLNRNVKLLGRRGVMTATLVCAPEEMATVAPIADRLLAGYRFQSGSRYAEFVPGKDAVAKYGLTALIAGGAGAVLVKSGLLGRLWKLMVVAVVAVGAGVKRFFSRGRPTAQGPVQPT